MQQSCLKLIDFSLSGEREVLCFVPFTFTTCTQLITYHNHLIFVSHFIAMWGEGSVVATKPFPPEKADFIHLDFT